MMKYKLSENGALMHASTGHKLLDMHFQTASSRTKDSSVIAREFCEAYAEEPLNAIRWAFFAGDVRQGMGERHIFRSVLPMIIARYPHLIKYVAEYNRFDSLLCLLDEDETRGLAMDVIKEQIHADLEAIKDGKGVSLIGKWLPSINASAKKTRKYALMISTTLFDSHRTYRKICSKLRKASDVLETKLCKNEWSAVDYSKIPSKAGFRYREAFKRHDLKRYSTFIAKAINGEVKMNVATVNVGEAVSQYRIKYNSRSEPKVDLAIEAVWQNFPDLMKQADVDLLPVCDMSGSMWMSCGRSTYVSDNAMALAIYCANHNKCEAFKNKVMTFADNPELVSVDKPTLAQNIGALFRADVGYSTNIEALFARYLRTLVDMKVDPSAKLPALIIFTDCEFNSAEMGRRNPTDPTLFGVIAKKFADYGYKMPRLIFWNLASRSGAVPVKQNDNGLVLLSGVSQNTLDMAFSNLKDPYDVLIEKLSSDRYKQIKLEP